MKVSIDGILGSARRINNQLQVGDESKDRGRTETPRTDSVEIENRISSRLDAIQKELREIQTSLTRNQIIRDGIGRLGDDAARGGLNAKSILDETRFEGKRALREFLGENISPEGIRTMMGRVDTLIGEDMGKLTRLQIEVENIHASTLASTGRAEDALRGIEAAFAKNPGSSIDSLSRVNADTVMRLIK